MKAKKDRVVRIIPRLDVKGPHLVKGIHLEGLRVLGFPQDFAKTYYSQGVDELIFQDVVASLYNQNNLKEIISKTAESMFIPLTVGGGLRTLSDIKEVLRAGADRVSINTQAIKSPQFIKQASEEFGTSTIVVAIEVIKQTNGEYLCFCDNGREFTGINAVEWAQQVEELGAGEIVLTSVDREGRGEGYDIELIQKVTKNLNISVIAHGGAGKIQDVIDVIEQTDVGGVAIASLLHYDFIKDYEIDFSDEGEGNFEFMKGDRTFSKITPSPFKDLKAELVNRGINVRAN